MGLAGIHIFWILFLGCLGLLILLGTHITKTWRGLFIDARCKVSLSRLQIIFWTVLLTSAVVWFAFSSKSTNVHIPSSLWALLGISGFSVVGSEVIKGTKSDRTSDPKTSTFMPESVQPMNTMGLLHKNPKATEARFIDIFKGEELLDFQTVDITKVQMFLISLFVFASYMYALLNADNSLYACAEGAEEVLNGLCTLPQGMPVPETGAKGYALPALTDGMVALLGISHGGYLAFKAAPKTPVQQ